MKKYTLSVLIFLSLVIFNACKKEDSSPNTSNNTAILSPSDTITSFLISFENTQDSSVEFGNYDDVDGPGPKSANIGGVSLKQNTPYKVTFRIEDGTNASNPIILNSKIKNNGKDYKLCITNNLGINSTATDSDGSMPIGLTYDLNTKNTGNGNITFTIKYQKGIKNGDCTPGTTYYTCTIPISVF
jgi:hypothetical protein